MCTGTAKLGNPKAVKAGKGKQMMHENKGKKLAAVIPEASLSDKLSSNPKLDRVIQARIGDQLRAMYDDLMQQPVPDRFTDLLAKLEQHDEEQSE
jgi:Anti-sigma factor NepR